MTVIMPNKNKMKTKVLASIVIFGMAVMVLSSCSKLPQAEIDAANAAIENARNAGADVYVPENFIALQDSLKSVMVNIEAQSSKFIKNYSAAQEGLTGVSQFAAEVQLQSETRKEELKIEIKNTIAEVKSLIESIRQLILEAPGGKEGTSALMAIKGEIDAVEISINEELTGVIVKYKSSVQSRRS